MGELIQTVKNGVIEQTNKSNTTEKSNNALGKDAFLQLLVTQMKYQDPLNPSSDTEYISQLATFSQLEQMQNLSNLTSTSQALSLVGKNVIIKTKSQTGTITQIGGKVDFVNISNGKANLSINGKLYSIDDLDSVIDDSYILEQGRPGIPEKADLTYDADDPADLSFKVSMGEGESTADDMIVFVENTRLDSSAIILKDNMITINKAVFENAPNGTYKVTVLFNDVLLTTVQDMVTVTVKNSEATVDDTEEPKDTDDTGDTEGPKETDDTENTEEPKETDDTKDSEETNESETPDDSDAT